MKVSSRSGGCMVGMAPLAPLAHALFAAALALPGAASAEPCVVEATGESTAEWAAAIESLSALALTDRDCARVAIEVALGRARVRFTTASGQSAERTIDAPSELRPTIDALRVQAPLAAEPLASKPAASAIAAPAPVVARRAPERADASDVRLALLAGLRGDDTLAGPVLTGELSLGAGLFELGGSLSAEPNYADLAGVRAPERQSSAAALGVHAGVRAPAGGFDLRAGGRVAFAPLLTVDHDTEACPPDTVCPFVDEDKRTSEWRFGAYAGLAVPRSAMFRFRLELAADVVTPSAEDSSRALTPAQALSGLIGVEVAP